MRHGTIKFFHHFFVIILSKELHLSLLWYGMNGACELHLQTILFLFKGKRKKKTSTKNFNQCLRTENDDPVKLLSLKVTNHIKRILKYRLLCITE